MEMRVLHVVATSQRRGSEIFAADLIHALDGSETSQHVAVLRPSRGHTVDFGAPVDMFGGGSLAHVSGLRRLVARWRPRVIQAHGGEALKASVLAFVDVPIVYRRIGGAPPALRHGWRRVAYQRLVARSARVVAVAEAVRSESITLFKIPPIRIVTIPNGVDARRLSPSLEPSAMRESLRIAAGAPVFLSMGALTWEKDPLALLRIAAGVLRRLPDSVYVVLGDGPMRSRMQTEVSSLGIEDRVRMLGVRGDAPDLLSLADALLFASRPDGMEGMPAALIEAGMLGTPSVAYDVAGVGEVVIDGRTGRLVPWGEEDALSEAMLDVLGNASTREAMGAAAQERCLADFSIERIAPRYLQLYEDVAAG
jgi:glycosyltransferase involved in cell wall biosynthesis